MTEYESFLAIATAGDTKPLELAPKHTALLVVGMQNCFTRLGYPFTDLYDELSPGLGSNYLKRVRDIVIPNISQLLWHCRNSTIPIFFTTVGTKTGRGDDIPPWLRAIDELGVATLGSRVWPSVDDPSWQIDEVLDARPNESILNSLSASAFSATGLEQELRSNNIESVIVTGVTTDICVASTAREAADRGFNVITIGDACTAMSTYLHDAILVSLRYVSAVRSTSEVLKSLENAAVPA